MDYDPGYNLDSVSDDFLRCSLEHQPPTSSAIIEIHDASQERSSQSSTGFQYQAELLPKEDDDNNSLICAICMDAIPWEDYCQVKGCDHSYCAQCLLRWVSHKEKPWCPQCRSPFSMLYLYRNLDGSMSDYLIEESVCLLLCAKWFKAPQREPGREEVLLYGGYVDEEEEEEEDLELPQTLRIGNRPWGENGYIRGGHLEARPVSRKYSNKSSKSASKANVGSSSSAGSESPVSDSKPMGRRARRAQQRRQADERAQNR